MVKKSATKKKMKAEGRRLWTDINKTSLDDAKPPIADHNPPTLAACDLTKSVILKATLLRRNSRSYN